MFPSFIGVPSEAEVSGKTPEAVSNRTKELHGDSLVRRPGLRIHPVKGRAVMFW